MNNMLSLVEKAMKLKICSFLILCTSDTTNYVTTIVSHRDVRALNIMGVHFSVQEFYQSIGIYFRAESLSAHLKSLGSKSDILSPLRILIRFLK